MRPPLKLEMKGNFSSVKVAIPSSFGLGFFTTWFATAIVRTLFLLSLGKTSLPWSQIPKLSLSLFAPELILLLIATVLKVAVIGLPISAFHLRKKSFSLEELTTIGFSHTARKTLRAVGVATFFAMLMFLLLKPAEGERYHESLVAKMFIGATAEKVFLPDRVVDISRGIQIPETIRVWTDAIAVGHLSLAAFLVAVGFIRLMSVLMKIDYAPTVFPWSQRKWPAPRDGGLR